MKKQHKTITLTVYPNSSSKLSKWNETVLYEYFFIASFCLLHCIFHPLSALLFLRNSFFALFFAFFLFFSCIATNVHIRSLLEGLLDLATLRRPSWSPFPSRCHRQNCASHFTSSQTMLLRKFCLPL